MKNRLQHIGFFFLSLTSLTLASCDQEDAPDKREIDDSTVAFFVSLPAVGSRAEFYIDGVNTLYNDVNGFHVTAFAPDTAKTGKLYPFREEFIVKRRYDGAYCNDTCRWPEKRYGYEGRMMFYAFYPSLSKLRASAEATDKDFVLNNYSEKKASGSVSYDYRIESFKINKDISKQSDFVAVGIAGSKNDNLYSGVQPDFEHQLSNIDFLAYNSLSEYNVEIAAVKICNVMTQGDFCFNRAPYALKGDNATGHWEYPNAYKKGTVEYIYNIGEKLLLLDQNNHTTKPTAESIFGSAGSAFLLPYDHKKWEHHNDVSNKNQGLYITALIRVEKRSTGVQIYPEPGHKYGSGGVHYYLINKNDGTIKDMELEIYVNNISGVAEGADKIIEVGADDKPIYYTDKDCKNQYIAPDGFEIRELSWAAIPFGVNLKPGYRYTYYIDYGKGVGVHDPTDTDNAVAPNVLIVGFEDWIEDYEVTLNVG